MSNHTRTQDHGSPTASTHEPIERAGHTPGPWRYRPYKYDDWGWIRAANDELVARVGLASGNESVLDEHRRNGTDPFWADAQLVSAAPELLAALKAVVAVLAKEAPGTRLNSHEFDGIGIQCHAAIAKATRHE